MKLANSLVAAGIGGRHGAAQQTSTVTANQLRLDLHVLGQELKTILDAMVVAPDVFRRP